MLISIPRIILLTIVSTIPLYTVHIIKKVITITDHHPHESYFRNIYISKYYSCYYGGGVVVVVSGGVVGGGVVGGGVVGGGVVGGGVVGGGVVGGGVVGGGVSDNKI
jgi:hypothetical protein